MAAAPRWGHPASGWWAACPTRKPSSHLGPLTCWALPGQPCRMDGPAPLLRWGLGLNDTPPPPPPTRASASRSQDQASGPLS